MIHRRSAVSVVILSLYAAVGYGQSIRKVPEYGKLPLNFEANQGQSDGRVVFLGRGKGYTLFLTKGEVVLASPKAAAVHMKFRGANPAAEISGVDEMAPLRAITSSVTIRRSRIRKCRLTRWFGTRTSIQAST